MNRKTLHQLYAEHTGKVSDKWSSYLSEYDRLFNVYRDTPVRLLEIGIQNGGSLEIWSKYFSDASAVIGCDINPDCAHLKYDDPSISVIVGNATEVDVREQVLQRSAQFDIIIDDGSHLSSDIIRTFTQYFPAVVEGGIFVAEDLHCSYWSQFEGGLFDPYSSISFFKRLADVINHEHWGIPAQRSDILRGIFTKLGCELDAEALSQIHSIEFVNSMCIVHKARATNNDLGHRVIAGSIETVVSFDPEQHNQPYQLDPAFDQSNNPWTARTLPPDEALPYVEELLASERLKIQLLQHEIHNRKQQTTALERQHTEISDEITRLLNSKSWRFTAPLRRVKAYTKILIGKLPHTADMSRPAATSIPAAVDIATIENIGTVKIIPQRNMRDSLITHGHRFYRRYMKGSKWGRLIGQQVLKRGLVSATELQISALTHDSLAIHRAHSSDSMPAQADSGVPGFHLSPPLNLKVSDVLATHPRINVLLPGLRIKHMSGGPNTALVLAALLAESGEQIRLIACDASTEGEEDALFPHMDALLQRPVRRDKIDIVDAFDRTRPTAIGINDIFLATAWWTAQIAKHAIKKIAHKTFIYLIQDFEPILHEGSTFQARALETYGLHHIPVINTRLLLDHLIKEGAGCYADPAYAANALWFEPALDRSYYFPDSKDEGHQNKKILLFYARPTSARRNLFELGVVALRQAVISGAIDKDNWEVWAMGEKLAPVDLGNGVILNPLPWMEFASYAKRVRTADLLLSLMLSPHPSYPPLEMAASGKLVVTNSFSVKTSKRMHKFSPNIIIAEPTAESIAAALQNAAGRINAGFPSYDPSGIVALPSDWDESMGELIPQLLQRIHMLRDASPDSNLPVAPGLPSVPKSDYERYRKACLVRRRQDGEYQQEPGLLSFVTSAYNTDPVFLEELGSSVFLQDGGMHFEWLILDNGSTNNDTQHALQQLGRQPGVRLERVEQNLGIIGGMRFLLERAHGRYILPLDSDDLIEPDCAHVLTRFIKDNDYPPLLYTDEDKLGAGRFGSSYLKPDWDPVLFLHSCYIAHLCIIDRELALQLDLYNDATAEGCHDWDSFIRFMDAGYVPQHIPEALYSWRIHETSTSGNIASKSYIAKSHRATLQRALNRRSAPHLELTSNPLFNHNVDWWYRRKHDIPVSCVSLTIKSKCGGQSSAQTIEPWAIIDAERSDSMTQLTQAALDAQTELLHLCWNGVTPDDDEWRWDAAGLLELFTDAVMVGGTLHNDNRVLDGPRIFGFGDGCDCPDRGRSLADPGYFATMWKARSVSAVSSGHCVVRRDFLLEVLPTLIAEKISVTMLGPWLGALAAQFGKRIVYSPFMRAKAAIVPEDFALKSDRAVFLSRFWSQLPETRFYSPRLGLAQECAYVPVSDADRDLHIKKLQLRTLPYSEWLDQQLRCRTTRYPAPINTVNISIVTPAYQGSNLDFLDELASNIASQSVSAFEWIVVVNGPMSEDSLALIQSKAAAEWAARLIVEPKAIGIVPALQLGLKVAKGEYVIPIDADDLIPSDAIQILSHEIDRLGRPDLVYTDEDVLIEGKPSAPYLRSAFDPVLALDNSTIWHLCAMKRDAALAADVYGDAKANWCQDWDTVSRISGAGGRVEHISEVLYHWRQHASSTTNNSRGDPRSLDSARYILERHIAHTAAPHHFYIDDWPENRGTRELFIARRSDDLPQFIWIGDAATSDAAKCNEDAILVIAANGVLIEHQTVFVEVARLLELHSQVGAIGGLVSKNGLVVDGCYIANNGGMLESPWLGQSVTYGGPYALALKPQSVAIAGSALAFFRVSALKQIGAWPWKADIPVLDPVAHLCSRLAKRNWIVAFSPLIQAHTSSTFYSEAIRRRSPMGECGVGHALARYGMSRGYID